MRLNNGEKHDKKPNELLAEARAIHFAMRHNAISEEDAKKRTEPMLAKLNKVGGQIAGKYAIKYRNITFQDLGTII